MASGAVARDLVVIALLFGLVSSLFGLGAYGVYSLVATVDDTAPPTAEPGGESSREDVPARTEPDAGANVARAEQPESPDDAATSTEESADGPLSRSAMQAVFARHRRAVRDCYERQLRSNPELEGTLVLELTIESSGRVARVKVAKNPSGSKKLGSCIRKQVRKWRFPAFSGPDVVVSYPLIFKSE